MTSEKSKPSEEDICQWIDNARSLRSLLRSDPHRPIYHFVAPEGAAMPFDPVAGIYWKGKYHLGYNYQKRPTSKVNDPFWTEDSINNGHVFGHLVSTDLLHWTQYPDMLDLKEGESEIAFCAGGAFLSREGVPHIIYMGVRGSKGAEWNTSNSIAYATDDELKLWKKFSKPALTALDPKDPTAGRYFPWDPDAWYDRNADCYYQISGQISGEMKPALFKSKDLHEWEYVGDLIDPSNIMRHQPEDMSAPEFFSLGNKSMLLFTSHQLGAQYYIGTFANDRFSAEQHGRMNWPGGTFFTCEHLQDAKGRNIIWGWVVERKPAHLPVYGWSGILSVPRVVSLGDDGKVRINPAEQLKTIRVQETMEKDIELAPNSERALKAQGKSIELKLEISGAEKSPVGVKVFASPDGREETVIFYDPVKKELAVDFSKSSVKGPVAYPSVVFKALAGYPERVSEQRAPLELKEGEPLKLNIFLDRSVIEVFANGTQCVTQVVYPELVASTAVKVFSGDEAVIVKNIQSWTMAETNAC